jgi:hypothetical protein
MLYRDCGLKAIAYLELSLASNSRGYIEIAESDDLTQARRWLICNLKTVSKIAAFLLVAISFSLFQQSLLYKLAQTSSQ